MPLLLSILPVRSVVDIGCGLGPWAAEFLAHGVPDVLGVDGDYVDRSQLRIPQDRFMAWNLLDPIRIDRVFDLAICLEVAEHLPDSRADGLVSDLTSLAPCVLFSAAVPGQGGTFHLNEQFLPYWVSLFRKHSYEGLDPFRCRILGNDSVEWWYQQNIVMFANRDHKLMKMGFPTPHTIIHQYLYERTKNSEFTLSTLARAFPDVLLRSLRHHLGFRKKSC